MGESGSGKTTLAMSIMHLLSYEGEIRICDKITQEKLFGDRQLRRNFQIIFQDPFSSLSPRMTIKQILSEGIVSLLKISENKKFIKCVSIYCKRLDLWRICYIDIHKNFQAVRGRELQ